MAKLLVNGCRKSKFDVRDLVFCILLLIWPTLQFCVFYIGVNLNSFLLVFQEINMTGTKQVATTSFEFFKENWDWCFNFVTGNGEDNFFGMLGMSLLSFTVSIFIGSPLGLLFSYYIFKKMRGSSFFRIVLYLPSIISALILVLFYKFFLDKPFSMYILHDKAGLSSSENTLVTVIMILFFNIFTGFGTSVLMYANAMSSISPEIIESASLDGAKGFKEFWHIVFPMIFPTWSVFFVNLLAMVLTNQANLYSFYGKNCPADLRNIGYWMFLKVKGDGGPAWYPRLALLGLMFSAVVIPITFIVRKLLEKYGPSAN